MGGMRIPEYRIGHVCEARILVLPRRKSLKKCQWLQFLLLAILQSKLHLKNVRKG